MSDLSRSELLEKIRYYEEVVNSDNTFDSNHPSKAEVELTRLVNYFNSKYGFTSMITISYSQPGKYMSIMIDGGN